LLQVQSRWADLQTRPKVDPELKNDVRKFLSFPSWVMNSQDGPTWYRGLAQEPEKNLASDVNAMLARLKLNAVVVAHTPQADGRINSRFSNHVFLIDSGMVFGLMPSALEIRGDRFTAYYLNGDPQPLTTTTPQSKVSSAQFVPATSPTP